MAVRNPLIAVGDKTLPQPLPNAYNGTLTLAAFLPSGAVAPVGMQLELWLSSNDGATWYRPMLRDPSTGTDVDYLSSLEQAAWCEAIGVTTYEVRLAALGSGGPVQARVEYRRN